MTLQTLRVLNVLLEDPTEPLWGFQISKHTRLAAGSLYPILARLERAGWLESEWEQADPSADGRPRRRYYRLTGLGVQQARQAVLDASEALQPGWA